ncbi:RHS repeat-associated core domain-containing protein, partial [Alkalispirochaeta americana]
TGRKHPPWDSAAARYDPWRYTTPVSWRYQQQSPGKAWVFAGKGYDRDIELYYFNARWYDATIGSFTSEDPARDGGNWYAYVGHNPLVYTDPTGLRAIA